MLWDVYFSQYDTTTFFLNFSQAACLCKWESANRFVWSLRREAMHASVVHYDNLIAPLFCYCHPPPTRFHRTSLNVELEDGQILWRAAILTVSPVTRMLLLLWIGPGWSRFGLSWPQIRVLKVIVDTLATLRPPSKRLITCHCHLHSILYSLLFCVGGDWHTLPVLPVRALYPPCVLLHVKDMQYHVWS